MAQTDVEGRLTEYLRRRDFAKTSEPRGGQVRAGMGLYAVQKHAARRLHFDFRLELDGVLLSWAVTRGPSTDPGERRLAVRTEDHPLDYADFEGTIPEGNYGAGTVMLWDFGRWAPTGDPREGLDEGKLKFTLYGERLAGGWVLIRMAPRKGEKRENWLLIKERDAEAVPGEEPRDLFRTSVRTGRSLDEIAGKTAAEHAERRSAKPARARASHSDAKDSSYAGVRLSHPDRVLYPQHGVTKAGLASYLTTVADRMLPHIAGRPLTLLRCPQGRAKKCFVQRHPGDGMPAAIRPVAIREKSGQRADYLYIDDAAGLAAAAQIGVLELHVWGAHRERIETPERIVFDLDPAEDVPFAEVRRAAQDIRKRLAGADLDSFPLLTGGKGIHVVVPIVAARGWEEVEAFARSFAYALAGAEPDRFIAKASKAARIGRIFVDWLRNQRGATAIAPYSPRARSGAPVATPVSWNELSRIETAAAYTIESVQRRLCRLRNDPWGGYFDCDQRIGDETLARFTNAGQQSGKSGRSRTMAKSHGKQIKDDKRYEELRGEGMSKEKAARIANAAADPKRNPSKKGGKSPAYEEWTKDDLLDRARSIGIEGRSKMKKDELIDAIRSH